VVGGRSDTWSANKNMNRHLWFSKATTAINRHVVNAYGLREEVNVRVAHQTRQARLIRGRRKRRDQRR